MIITRRTLIFTGLGAAAFAACTPGPGTISIAATMAAGANPGPDGADRPLTLTLLELTTTDAFDGADVLALQDPQSALGPSLLRSDQLVLAPGGSAMLDIPVIPGATALGIVAGFRDASGKTFRTTTALPATGDVSVNISISSAGLSLA